MPKPDPPTRAELLKARADLSRHLEILRMGGSRVSTAQDGVADRLADDLRQVEEALAALPEEPLPGLAPPTLERPLRPGRAVVVAATVVLLLTAWGFAGIYFNTPRPRLPVLVAQLVGIFLVAVLVAAPLGALALGRWPGGRGAR